MPCITTCTVCGANFEAGSEEQANEPTRLCRACRWEQDTAQDAFARDECDEDEESASPILGSCEECECDVHADDACESDDGGLLCGECWWRLDNA